MLHARRTQRRGRCTNRWTAYGSLIRHTQGGSRMRESRTYGSVRGALSNERPYRNRPWLLHCIRGRNATNPDDPVD
jgi:hypothetical protein